MRAVTLCLVAAILAATLGLQGAEATPPPFDGTIRKRQEARLAQARRHTLLHRQAAKVMPPPMPPTPASGGGSSTNNGALFELALRFIKAIHYKNWTEVDSLLDPEAFTIDTDVSCGTLDKAEFMWLAQNSNVSQAQFVPLWFTDTNGFLLMRGEVAATFLPGTPQADITIANNAVYYILIPGETNTTIAAFERFSDRTWGQPNNATQMSNVFTQLAAATILTDIETWDRLLADDFYFQFSYGWTANPAFQGNRSAFLQMQAEAYSQIVKGGVTLKVEIGFPVCDLYLAEFLYIAQMKDGQPARIQKSFLALQLDSNFTIVEMNQFALGLFHE
jgi:hypothetical protein